MFCSVLDVDVLFNLTPFIPLSNQQDGMSRIDKLIGEGEEFIEGGEAHLFFLLPLPLRREGGQRDRFIGFRPEVRTVTNCK
jgi:hypothetical protein